MGRKRSTFVPVTAATVVAPVQGWVYPRVGADQYQLPAPAPVAPCAVCEHRRGYGIETPCDAHKGDVWAGAR